MKLEKFYLLKIVVVIVLLIPLLYWMDYNDKKTYAYYVRFNQTNIDGEIEDVEEMLHGTSFKIKNDTLEFQFYPYPDEKGISFLNIASKGMRVKKLAYSDTILLLNDKMEWKFAFLSREQP